MMIPNKYCSKTSEELDDYVSYYVQDAFHWEVFLMIDYNNHHKDNDYDGGLSFINRIYDKLGWYHTEWNVEEIRNSIKTKKDYISAISDMLGDEESCMYGLHFIKNTLPTP